ncbi:MAG: YciI family protein [Thermomicrobiales bacterium]|nr:YciI family protein [Thermomicrobiales bacterium]
MKFMLLIYGAENAWSEAERNACYAESAQLARDLSVSGHYIAANPLKSVATATSVKVRDGKPIITDGPFAETREQLGGYFLIEARDHDEALQVAQRIPGARIGTVEIRPVLEISGLPGEAALLPGASLVSSSPAG